MRVKMLKLKQLMTLKTKGEFLDEIARIEN